MIVGNHENGSLACYPVESGRPARRRDRGHPARGLERAPAAPARAARPLRKLRPDEPLPRRLRQGDRPGARLPARPRARGRLLPNDPPGARPGRDLAPRHLAFHPSGRYAFVINELNSTLTAFAFDPDTGALRGDPHAADAPGGLRGPQHHGRRPRPPERQVRLRLEPRPRQPRGVRLRRGVGQAVGTRPRLDAGRGPAGLQASTRRQAAARGEPELRQHRRLPRRPRRRQPDADRRGDAHADARLRQVLVG